MRAAAFIKLLGLELGICALFVSTTQTAAAGSARQGGSVRLPTCSWNQPGHDPFMGNVVAAVDRYQDIPVSVRARLKQRMAQRDYDDIASIRRDSLEGKYHYAPAIRDMHFGINRVCTEVSRQKWAVEQQERGLVYCEGKECVLVPTVCRNVSRITRLAPHAAAPAPAPASATGPSSDELLFDPPAAGQPLATLTGPVATFESGSLQDRISSVGFAAGSGSGLLGVPGSGGGSRGSGSSGAQGGDVAAVLSQPKDLRLTDSGRNPGSILPNVAAVPVSPVPEPATLLLLLLGLCACWTRAAHNARAACTV